jgi:hypothetical protein
VDLSLGDVVPLIKLRDGMVTREHRERLIDIISQKKKHSFHHPTGGLDIERRKYGLTLDLNRTKMSTLPLHRRFHI